MWMAGEHEQEEKGTGSPLSSSSKLLHRRRQPVNFHFLCLLPLGAGRPFLLHVRENYCFPGISHKLNIWVSLQSKYKVAFSRRHFSLVVPTQVKSAFVTYVPKHGFLHPTHWQAFMLSTCYWSEPSFPVHRSGSRLSNQRLNYTQDILPSNSCINRGSSSPSVQCFFTEESQIITDAGGNNSFIYNTPWFWRRIFWSMQKPFLPFWLMQKTKIYIEKKTNKRTHDNFYHMTHWSVFQAF